MLQILHAIVVFQYLEYLVRTSRAAQYCQKMPAAIGMSQWTTSVS